MRWPITFAVAAIAVIGVGVAIDRNDGTDAAAAVMPSDIPLGYGDKGYRQMVASVDDTVRSRRNRLDASKGGWLHREALAIALMDRFALTGEMADMEEARDLLDTGLADAPVPSGPTLTRAALAMSLHDLSTTSRMIERFALAAPRRTSADRAVAEAFRGDVAMQRGELVRAKQHYEKAAVNSSGVGAGMRQADVALWSGNPPEAARLSEDTLANSRVQPWHFAKAALQRANIAYAAGDLETAGTWIDAANEAFPGFWVFEAYAAQNRASQGEWDEGIAQLEKLAQTTGEPDVIDLLAGMLAHGGRESEAAEWSSRAEIGWKKKLSEGRDAYRLHAAEHYLDFGDVGTALNLAREEYGKRRSGEVGEVYASALTANGRPRDALRVLKDTYRRGWRSVSLDLAHADAHRALGNEDEAERWEARSLELSPLALDPRRKLLRFGHY